MNTQITTKKPEWYRTLDLMIHSNVMNSEYKARIAKQIWDKKYRYKYDFEEFEYIRKYVKISKIIHITKLFSYINDNYAKIFSFNNENIQILKVNQRKRIELLLEINNISKTMKLSKGQKKKIILAKKIINIKQPNMCYEIGKVLNRLFIKDISLHITEYI